jgi:hypothetical protein
MLTCTDPRHPLPLLHSSAPPLPADLLPSPVTEKDVIESHAGSTSKGQPTHLAVVSLHSFKLGDKLLCSGRQSTRCLYSVTCITMKEEDDTGKLMQGAEVVDEAEQHLSPTTRVHASRSCFEVSSWKCLLPGWQRQQRIWSTSCALVAEAAPGEYVWLNGPDGSLFLPGSLAG